MRFPAKVRYVGQTVLEVVSGWRLRVIAWPAAVLDCRKRVFMSDRRKPGWRLNTQPPTGWVLGRTRNPYDDSHEPTTKFIRPVPRNSDGFSPACHDADRQHAVQQPLDAVCDSETAVIAFDMLQKSIFHADQGGDPQDEKNTNPLMLLSRTRYDNLNLPARVRFGWLPGI